MSIIPRLVEITFCTALRWIHVSSWHAKQEARGNATLLILFNVLVTFVHHWPCYQLSESGVERHYFTMVSFLIRIALFFNHRCSVSRNAPAVFTCPLIFWHKYTLPNPFYSSRCIFNCILLVSLLRNGSRCCLCTVTSVWSSISY